MSPIVNPWRVCWAALLLIFSAAAADAASLLDRAVTLMEQGKPRDAEIVMKQGLQASPHDPELRYLLGKLYLDNGNPPAAEKELRIARADGMPDDLVLFPLGRSYLLQEKFDALLADLPDDATLPDSQRAQVLTLRALARLGLGDRDEARGTLKAALALDPDNREAQIAAARLQIVSNDAEGAKLALDRLLKRYPECVECWQLLGDAEQRRQQPEAADKAYSRVLQLQPDDFLATVGRATLALGRGDLDTADLLLQAARKQRPEAPMVAFLGASLAYQKGDISVARELIPKAVNAMPEHVPTILLDGLIARAAGQTAQARERLRRALSGAPGNILALKALAGLELAENHPEEVVKLLEPVLRRGAGDGELRALMATAEMQMGNTARADELMTDVARDEPGMQVQLAANKLAEGDVTAGFEGLREAAARDPEATRPVFLMAVSLLQQEKFDEALETAESLRARQPDNPAYLNLIGAAQIGRQDLDAAELAFNEALKRADGFLPARQNLARVALLRGDIETARKQLDGVLARDPGNPDALLQLARIDAAGGKPDAAITELRTLLAKHPEHVIAARILVENLLLRGRANEAVDVARGLLQARPDDVDGERLLARAQLAQGEVEAAIGTLKHLLDRRPDSAPDQRLLGAAALQAKDRDTALTAYRRAYELDSADLDGSARLVQLLLEGDQYDEAGRIIRRMRLRHALKALPYELAGDLDAREGNVRKAADEYDLALLREPSARLLMKRYQARPAQAGGEAGLQPLRDWLAAHPEDSQLRLFLAAELERLGDPAVGAEYEAVLRYDATNVVALNNLAMRALTQDPVVALTYAELAHEHAPDDPFVLDTYAQALLAAKRPAEAVPLLEKAIDLLKTEPELRFNLARALEAANRPGPARDQLRRIVITYGDYPRMPEVKAMLARLQTR